MPVITHTKIRLPEFKLTGGNLTTTVDGHLTAFYGPVPAIYPPPLSPIRFGKNPPQGLQVPFNGVTNPNGILRLWSLNGREFPFPFPFVFPWNTWKKIDSFEKYSDSVLIALVVRHLSEGAIIYEKPIGNIGTLKIFLPAETRRQKLTRSSDPTITLKLEIHHPKHKSAYVDDEDQQSMQVAKHCLE